MQKTFFSFFKWSKEETVSVIPTLTSLCSVWMEQRSSTRVWSSHVCILRYFIFQDTARFSQRLTNKFKQPWLWRTSLSGSRWAELMSWMSSSTVNRSAWLYGAHSFLCKNHPAADMLNISTTSDCRTQTTSPRYKKVFSSQYRLVFILIVSKSE